MVHRVHNLLRNSSFQTKRFLFDFGTPCFPSSAWLSSSVNVAAAVDTVLLMLLLLLLLLLMQLLMKIHLLLMLLIALKLLFIMLEDVAVVADVAEMHVAPRTRENLYSAAPLTTRRCAYALIFA